MDPEIVRDTTLGVSVPLSKSGLARSFRALQLRGRPEPPPSPRPRLMAVEEPPSYAAGLPSHQDRRPDFLVSPPRLTINNNPEPKPRIYKPQSEYDLSYKPYYVANKPRPRRLSPQADGRHASSEAQSYQPLPVTEYEEKYFWPEGEERAIRRSLLADMEALAQSPPPQAARSQTRARPDSDSSTRQDDSAHPRAGSPPFQEQAQKRQGVASSSNHHEPADERDRHVSFSSPVRARSHSQSRQKHQEDSAGVPSQNRRMELPPDALFMPASVPMIVDETEYHRSFRWPRAFPEPAPRRVDGAGAAMPSFNQLADIDSHFTLVRTAEGGLEPVLLAEEQKAGNESPLPMTASAEPAFIDHNVLYRPIAPRDPLPDSAFPSRYSREYDEGSRKQGSHSLHTSYEEQFRWPAPQYRPHSHNKARLRGREAFARSVDLGDVSSERNAPVRSEEGRAFLRKTLPVVDRDIVRDLFLESRRQARQYKARNFDDSHVASHLRVASQGADDLLTRARRNLKQVQDAAASEHSRRDHADQGMSQQRHMVDASAGEGVDAEDMVGDGLASNFIRDDAWGTPPESPAASRPSSPRPHGDSVAHQQASDAIHQAESRQEQAADEPPLTVDHRFHRQHHPYLIPKRPETMQRGWVEPQRADSLSSSIGYDAVSSSRVAPMKQHEETRYYPDLDDEPSLSSHSRRLSSHKTSLRRQFFDPFQDHDEADVNTHPIRDGAHNRDAQQAAWTQLDSALDHSSGEHAFYEASAESGDGRVFAVPTYDHATRYHPILRASTLSEPTLTDPFDGMEPTTRDLAWNTLDRARRHQRQPTVLVD